MRVKPDSLNIKTYIAVHTILWLEMTQVKANPIAANDLAQINATVIIGLLVLLGVSNLIPTGQVVSSRTAAMK